MPTLFKDDAQRDAFLAEPRLGILITHHKDDAPMGVPVWFEWTGLVVRMFSGKDSPKVRRIQADPRVSVLVTNHVGEAESWVAFDGTVEVSKEGGIELANRLAPRYWNLDDEPQNRATLDTWQRSPEAFCLLTLTPDRIRTGR